MTVPKTIDIIVIAIGLFLSFFATKIIIGIAIIIAIIPPRNHHKFFRQFVSNIINGTIKQMLIK